MIAGRARAGRPGGRRRPIVVGLALVALTGAGCSDGELATGELPAGAVEPSTSEATAPSTDPPAPTAPEATAVPSTAAPAPSTGAPVREAPTTSLRPASSGLPEVRSLNSRHEPIELDETALLACANNQIAFVSLQRSDTATATRELVAASLRAKDSDVGDVSAASNGLMVAATSADPSPTVLAFLGLCTDHGFEY